MNNWEHALDVMGKENYYSMLLKMAETEEEKKLIRAIKGRLNQYEEDYNETDPNDAVNVCMIGGQIDELKWVLEQLKNK